MKASHPKSQTLLAIAAALVLVFAAAGCSSSTTTAGGTGTTTSDPYASEPPTKTAEGTGEPAAEPPTPLTDDLGEEPDQPGYVPPGTPTGTDPGMGTTPPSAPTGTPGAAGAMGTTAAQAPPETLDTGAILGAIQTVNRNELEAGKVAASKSQNPQVRAYADKSMREHSAAHQKMAPLAAGVQVRRSMVSEGVEQSASTAMAELQTLSGAEFDRAYLDSEVMMHTGALSLLDQQLIPAASADGAVLGYLQDMRTMVASHLDEARQLLGALGTGGQ